MQTETRQTFIDDILRDISRDDFVLPPLPNVASRIHGLLDDPNISADQVVSALSSDPILAAQIIKSANSAVFADKPQVNNVRDAATRLGYRQLHSLVIAITVQRLFDSNNPVTLKRMKHIWEHSRKVAALSYVLAARQPYLIPEQAMLAGLMHNIGMLPVCLHLDKHHVEVDDDTMAIMLNRTHRTIGCRLLQKWHFSEQIIEVVAEHENFQRTSSNAPLMDYVDVVMFANLKDSPRSRAVAWDNIPAIGRLGMDADECRTFIEHNAEAIERVEVLLGMKPVNKPPLTRIATQSNKPEITPVAHENRQRSNGLFSSLLKFWR